MKPALKFKWIVSFKLKVCITFIECILYASPLNNTNKLNNLWYCVFIMVAGVSKYCADSLTIFFVPGINKY